jgi:hypothetical protein
LSCLPSFLKIDVKTAQTPEILILINVAEEIKLFVIPFSICKIALNLTSNFFEANIFSLHFVLQHLMSMNSQIDFCVSLFSGGKAICKLSSTADKANVPNDSNQQKFLPSHTHKTTQPTTSTKT